MSYGEISPLQMKNYGGEVARHIRSFTEPPPKKGSVDSPLTRCTVYTTWYAVRLGRLMKMS